ncbi:AraC family transcriptional regulator [Paenibacillus humicola]|uniref:AraC family transcriptional regulator n=1 Tax=Paenibacillus humicola TaxID=3110540 RepID=UPI00237B2816|nr:AraC family transcriptional regulator [Paenibacillus humicola]
MDINRLSPYIRVAMDSVIEPPWHIPERVIFDYELLFVKEGHIIVTVEDEQYAGKPDDIFLFKPGQRHSIRLAEGTSRFRQPHIHFDLIYRPDSPKVKVSFKPLRHMTAEEKAMIREDWTAGLPVRLPAKIALGNPDYFEKLLFDVIAEFQMKLPFYEMNVKGMFVKLWTYLLREMYRAENPEVYSRMDELTAIKAYLEHLTDRDVTLDELSARFNISKYHLVRLFKKAFAATPIHYHQMVRIGKAKEMIQFTGLNLTKIAEQFGFGSLGAFSRTFKNIEGVPASYYRNRK